MSALITSFACEVGRLQEHRGRSWLKVRAHSLRDEEGRSDNIVDSNMKLLKERIEVLRAKERLEINHRSYGRDYTSKYIHKRPKKQTKYLQTIALICGTSSLPILFGTLLLSIFSIIVHLNIM
ncbi:hypothetical protein R6Q59_033713 [Mikania micrantha]